MQTIYRYNLKLTEEQTISFPSLAESGRMLEPHEQVLKVDIIRGIPSIWVLVDTELPECELPLTIYGTGWSTHKAREQYLGSVIFDDSGEIYHVFY